MTRGNDVPSLNFSLFASASFYTVRSSFYAELLQTDLHLFVQISYLEQPQDIGYHDGDHAERGAYHAAHRLMGNVDGHLAVLALVLRYVLKRRKTIKVPSFSMKKKNFCFYEAVIRKIAYLKAILRKLPDGIKTQFSQGRFRHP